MLSDHERTEQLSYEFQKWYTSMVHAKLLTLDAFPEITAILWVHLRQHLPIEQAANLLRAGINHAEEQIKDGNIRLQLEDGSEYDYKTAEEYEGKEEMREMLIELSHNTFDPDAELRNLTGE